MPKQKFSRKDFHILCAVAGILIVFCLIFSFFFQKNGKEIEITVNGNLYGTYSLSRDKLINVSTNNGVSNKVQIKNHCAYMEYADCPDLLCEKQGKISKINESIVCLPNQVVVTVVSDSPQDSNASFDTFVQ